MYHEFSKEESCGSCDEAEDEDEDEDVDKDEDKDKDEDEVDDRVNRISNRRYDINRVKEDGGGEEGDETHRRKWVEGGEKKK
ncbi:hypothetical protein V1477_008209 [Vespula maculifrons]|uniref:Uncharacterized protein n=1 Tax=Vespula maculifrons TaxID=7453 RepID=A0ABD2CD28_VESMC